MIHWKRSIVCCGRRTKGSGEQNNKEKAVVTAAVQVVVLVDHLFDACAVEAREGVTRAVDHGRSP